MKEESEFNDGEPGSKVNADTLERAETVEVAPPGINKTVKMGRKRRPSVSQ